MKKISEPIVFFGSGPVAAEALKHLASDFIIEAVITKPVPQHHRGTFPVLTLAKTLNLPIHTASSKHELDELFARETFKSRLAILIDFGIIVSQKVIDSFPLGIVNSHFSILPEWRGADPITFAILSGQQQTGVSLMLLVVAMDEGPLLAYGEQDLSSAITTPELTASLIELSHALLVNTIPDYLAGECKLAPQDITKRSVSYSRKLTKNDGLINWSKSAAEIEREIRAFIEWPKSRTTIASKDTVITKARIINETGTSGKTEVRGKELIIFCGKDALLIEKLKPAGKSEMTSEAFLAGHRHLLT